MRLSHKIIAAFLVVIAIFGVVSVISTSTLLDSRMRHEVATSEVLFARSLAARLFNHVRDRQSALVTDALMDEQQLRSEKIEYLFVTDRQGKLLAHTFLSRVPTELSALSHPFVSGESRRIQSVRSPRIFAFDVAVPVLEGIEQIGAVHVGLKGQYLESIKVDVMRVTVLATLAIAVLATIIALVLTALIVRPLRSLTVVANELSNGNVDVELPDIQTRDEIRDLADAIRGVMAALVTLVGEVEALSSAARLAAGSEEEPGQGAHQQEAE